MKTYQRLERHKMHKIAREKPSLLKRTLNHLYWGKRLSMAKIGKLLEVDAATICRYMKKLGIKSRSLSEASTKYPKSPFSGSTTEMAYLLGLMGDIHARYHRLQVDISLTTTHPAMIRLFESCFGKYGHVNKYPMLNPNLNYYEWHCYCNLHPSFSFLMVRNQNLSEWMLNDDNLFYWYLSGLIDSEGFITVGKCKNKKQRHEYTRYLIGISSTDLHLLNQVAEKLCSLGYIVKIRVEVRSNKAFKEKKKVWSLRIERKPDVLNLMLNLKLHHQEKAEWKELALEIAKQNSIHWNEVADRVIALRGRIKQEVQLCRKEAEKMYVAKHSTPVRPSL